SVDDLLTLTRHEAGRTAVSNLGLQADLHSALDRAAVLRLPGVPPQVAQSLLSIGITSPDEFFKRDPSYLADAVSRQLNVPISPTDMACWQHAVTEVFAIPRPRTAAQ